MVEGSPLEENGFWLYEDMLEELVDDARTMPQRPGSHILETESENFFRGIVPSSWVIQDVKYDYGKDFLVEVFLGNKATGLEFLVQIKATNNLRRRKYKVIMRMEVKTINYLLANKVPSLLLVYDGKTGKGYYMWIEDYVKHELEQANPTWATQKTVDFKIPEVNVFTYWALAEIVSCLAFKNLSPDIEPLKLIHRLCTFSRIVDENSLREWLEQGHDEKIVRFLEDADVKTMLRNGTLNFTDIYVSSVLWEISESLRRPALGFARRMVMALIEADELLEAAFAIHAIPSENNSICQEMYELWWEQWSKEPNLELAFEMIGSLPRPESARAKQCLTKLYQFLEWRFYSELKNFSELVDSYLKGKSGGRLIDWLIGHVGYSPYGVHKMVELLAVNPATRRKLHELVDHEAEWMHDLNRFD